MSNALITAWIAPSTIRCHTVIRSVNAKNASAADCTIAATCVHTITRWRFQRSTSTPASGAITELGACPKNATRPSSTPECVSRYVIHTVANRVSHVPTSDTPWPMKNRR